MKLCFLRHATAVDAASNDSCRWLTTGGRHEAARIAHAAAKEGLVPTRIVSSPFVRAVQTAELFAGGTSFEGAIEIEPFLAPNGQSRSALEPYAESAGEGDVVLFVGHEPSISHYARNFAGNLALREFRKAELVVLERDANGYRFRSRRGVVDATSDLTP